MNIILHIFFRSHERIGLLKPYTDSQTYTATHDENFEVLRCAFLEDTGAAVVAFLADQSGLLLDEIQHELERRLLIAFEYSTQNYKVRSLGPLLYFSLLMFRRIRLPWSKTWHCREAKVVFDIWHEGTYEVFYKECDDALQDAGVQTETMRWSDCGDIRFLHAFRHLFTAGLLYLHLRRFERQNSMATGGAAFSVLFDAILGREMAGRSAALVLVSANDNGTSQIKAKAAGLKLVLIQNGYRFRESGARSITADHYLSIEPMGADSDVVRLGYFGETHCCGAFSALQFLRSAGKTVTPVNLERSSVIDILWVSCIQSGVSGRPGVTRLQSHESELASVRLLCALADQGAYRIRYAMRMEDELSFLRDHGACSEAISYIPFGSGSIYANALASDVTLSYGSTVVLESIALGGSGGFFSAHEIKGLNEPARDLGIMVATGSIDDLATFIQSLPEQGAVIRKQQEPLECACLTWPHRDGLNWPHLASSIGGVHDSLWRGLEALGHDEDEDESGTVRRHPTGEECS